MKIIQIDDIDQLTDVIEELMNEKDHYLDTYNEYLRIRRLIIKDLRESVDKRFL